MVKKYSLLLSWLVAILTLAIIILMLTKPSWSSPAQLFVNNPAPQYLPATQGAKFSFTGGGFSPETSLWLVPERSTRSATAATLETYSTPFHFVRRDDFLYVANGPGGFLIVAGLQSPIPSIIGVLSSDGQGMEISLRKDEALLAAGTGGLKIIDIRDKAKPQLMASLKEVAPALSVASKETIAYVATGKRGLQIVDLSDPRNPRRLGQINNHFDAYKVLCTENLLIIATGTTGLIYDIHIPTQPQLLGELPVKGGMNTVMAQEGETLYWATKSTKENRLFAIDLSRPNSPSILSSAPLNGAPYGISYNDKKVAVAMGGSGTKLFYAPAGETLRPLGDISAHNRTNFALSLDNDLWTADGGEGLLRIKQKEAMELHVPAILSDFSLKITPIVTPELFILGDEKGLSIYDRMDDTAPILLARMEITGITQQYLSADNSQIWLIKPDMLISIDISAPHSPRIIAELPLSAPSMIVGESEKTLVVAGQSTKSPLNYITRLTHSKMENLLLIDTTLRENPSHLLTYPLGTKISGIGLSDSTLVLMQPDGIFRILDLTVPQEPKELGKLQMPWLQSAAWQAGVTIEVKDQMTFISTYLAEIIVIDIHDPLHPKQIGTMSLPGPVNSLLSFDHFLFAGTAKIGLAVIDLKDPHKAELLGTIPLPGTQQRYCVQGGTLWYISSNTQGLWSIPLPRRLQSTKTDSNQIDASLEQPPPAGAYRLWMTDQTNHLVLPEVIWIGTKNPGR